MAMMYRPKNLNYEKELKKAYKKMVKFALLTAAENPSEEGKEYLNFEGEFEALGKYIEALEYWSNHPNHL